MSMENRPKGKDDECPDDEKEQRHVHEFLGSTRLAEEGKDRHNHRFAGVTGPAILSGTNHYHEFSTRTDFFEEHFHGMQGRTGLAINVGGGKHVHFAESVTTVNDEHRHTLVFATLIEDPSGPEPHKQNPGQTG